MNIDKIISRFLAGKAGSEELAQLEIWKKENEANMQRMNALIELQEAGDELKDYKQYDVEAALEKVDEKLLPVQRSIAWRKWGMIAAVVGVLLVALVGVQYAPTAEGPERYVANEAIEKAILIDGTVVTLDRGASLELGADYPMSPSVILSGRAYFDVMKQEEGKRFTVDLDRGKVEVVGTAFSIWSDSLTTEVKVTEGHVQYILDNRKIDLYAGEMIQLINNDIVKMKMKSDHNMTWMNKRLVFKDSRLASAIRDIEDHFKIKIEFDETMIKDCRISATYIDQELDSILEEWKALFDMKYKVLKNEVVILSTVCK